MFMTDEHCVYLVRGYPLQQPWHRCEAKVNEQTEPVLLDQVAAARLARGGPRAAPAKHREPHPKESIE
jgi:hypothetical protein